MCDEGRLSLPRPRSEYLLRLAILCAVYFGLAKAGLALAFTNESVTSIWPPTGLALAAVLVLGYRMWPAIAVGAFLANITTAGPAYSDVAIATGNTLEAVVGAFLLTWVGFRPSLRRIRDVVALVVLAGMASTAISATIGVSSLWGAGLVSDHQLASTWRVWWFGDMGGDLVVAPALLIFASRPSLPRRPGIHAEALALVAVLAGVSVAVFSSRMSFSYLMIPVLLLIALRFEQPGTALAGLVASGIAIWSTSQGHGPFIGGSADSELLRAQLFVGVALITGLVAAALTTERRGAEERLRRLADHDVLTGALNRRRFAEELNRWIAYSNRYGGQGAVLVLDVDRFKNINDEFGHGAGDDVLVRIAALLRERVRSTDFVARLGGDEFAVLLPHADEEQSLALATAVLEKVRNEGTVTVAGQSMPVTVSIGVGCFSQDLELGSDQVIRIADAAMYEAKDAGRDQVRSAVPAV
jgi:diguanylate cyclase (GGDEF)-like protein